MINQLLDYVSRQSESPKISKKRCHQSVSHCLTNFWIEFPRLYNCRGDFRWVWLQTPYCTPQTTTLTFINLCLKTPAASYISKVSKFQYTAWKYSCILLFLNFKAYSLIKEFRSRVRQFPENVSSVMVNCLVVQLYTRFHRKCM